MMDMQTCKVKQCGKRFDFDKGGLGSSFGGYVCGDICAKKSATKAGRAYAIHDETGKIIETNAPKEKTDKFSRRFKRWRSWSKKRLHKFFRRVDRWQLFVMSIPHEKRAQWIYYRDILLLRMG